MMCKRINTQLNKPTNQNLVKIPRVVKPTNKKKFGNQSNKQPIVPPALSVRNHIILLLCLCANIKQNYNLIICGSPYTPLRICLTNDTTQQRQSRKKDVQVILQIQLLFGSYLIVYRLMSIICKPQEFLQISIYSKETINIFVKKAFGQLRYVFADSIGTLMG